ncbi:MAG TPA: hypothetical protein VGM56_17210 [Byssovorax sp.]|jgi:hypothetical protein
MRRTRARLYPALVGVAGVVGALAATGVGSCTTETFGSGGNTTGPEGFTITDPMPNACIVVPPGPMPTFPILVDVQNFDLRPPGACDESLTSSATGSGGSGGSGGAAPILLNPCGHFDLKVNGVENNQGAGSEIDVLLYKLASRYGKLHISIEVIREQRYTFDLVDAGTTILPLDVVTVDTPDKCPGGSVTVTSTSAHGSGGRGGGGSNLGGFGGFGGMSGVGGLGGSGGGVGGLGGSGGGVGGHAGAGG